MQKKRYAGVYYTKADVHDKIDTKGMETIRRDNCPLVGRVMNMCLELMLLKRYVRRLERLQQTLTFAEIQQRRSILRKASSPSS